MDVQKFAPSVDGARVESSRYALIRRLGYLFRHHLVVNLQPLGMVCQVMQHRLSAPTLDVPAMQDRVEQVNRLVRTSIDSCLDVVSWLTAEAQASVEIGKAVEECIANVRSSFSFRNFLIHCEQINLETEVSQVAVREVLTAALIAVADHANGLDEIVVSVSTASNVVEIGIELRSGANTSFPEQGAYRLLGWEDVEILATYHGLKFDRISADNVQIRVFQ